MSNYMTQAQLEEQRRQRLKANLEHSLEKMQDQMGKNTSKTSEQVYIQMVNITSIISDRGERGFVQKKDKVIHLNHNVQTVNEIDRSGLMKEQEVKEDPLAVQLRELIKTISKRAILNKEDQIARKAIEDELRILCADQAIDIEDQIRIAQMKISSYLREGQAVTEQLVKEIGETMREYAALCALNGKTARSDILPDEAEKEIAKMKTALLKEEEDRYIVETLSRILGELGFEIKGETILDEQEGKLYTVDGNTLCDVFISNEGTEVMFEPVPRITKGSLETEKKVMSSVSSICSKYAELEKRARAEGIILDRIYLDEAENSVKFIREDEHSSQAGEKKARTMGE